jgi:hypothetical protein
MDKNMDKDTQPLTRTRTQTQTWTWNWNTYATYPYNTIVPIDHMDNLSHITAKLSC